MRILVTGANGMLGKAVVAELLRRGHFVRALVRPAARIDPSGWPGSFELFYGDLRVAKNLDEAFAGIDGLVHLAAAVTGDGDLQFASTVVGTERLLAAMEKSQTKAICLASSYSVYDWSETGREITENSPVESGIYNRDGYAIAKIWQERLVRRCAQKNGWQLTVLRPGFIWGADNAFVPGLGLVAGKALAVVAPAARLPMTHVANCASAFVAAVENMDRAAGHTFNVVDGHGLSSWRYAKEYLKNARARGVRVPVPYAVGMCVAKAARAMSNLFFGPSGKLPGLIDPLKYEARFKPVQSRPDKLGEVLHWTPPYDARACFELTYGKKPGSVLAAKLFAKAQPAGANNA